TNNFAGLPSGKGERAVVPTVAPPIAKRRTFASPTPLLPPVMKTRLPTNSASPMIQYRATIYKMTRTHDKVRYAPKGKRYTAVTAAQGVEDALRVLEGRWKLIILFRLFGGKVLRFSDLERAIPAISQKMLIQQLRQMERDGVVRRVVHHQVPPKVEYGLTAWGQALCPALDALLTWAAQREAAGQGSE